MNVVRQRYPVVLFSMVVFCGGSAESKAEFVYDFESLTVNQSIIGQDGWEKLNEIFNIANVTYGTGVNTSKVAKGAYSKPAAAITRRPFDEPLFYTSVDTDIHWRLRARNGNGFPVNSAWGGGGRARFGLEGGATDTATYLDSPGFAGKGDLINGSHWHEFELVVDFSVLGGEATLFHRDLTAGIPTFTMDGTIQNKSLGLTPDGTGRYEIPYVFLRLDGGGEIDNVFMQVAVPEPSACALFGIAAMIIAATQYRRRKTVQSAV